MMPFIHDAFWMGAFALLALVAWKAAHRFNLRVPAFGVRGSFGFGGTPDAGKRTPPKARSSGNTAFDDWRDGELVRLEAERQTLEAKLHAFEGFVDKLRRAKDRETFDRFLATDHDRPHAVLEPTVESARV